MWKRNGKLYLSGFVGLTLLLGALQASAADHSRKRGPGPRGPGTPAPSKRWPGPPMPGTRQAAAAGVFNQHVSVVSVDWEIEPTTGQLRVQLPTGDYSAVADRDKCGLVVSADTVKAWHNLAQAAFLSGKTVSIGYTDCGSHHYIRWLGING